MAKDQRINQLKNDHFGEWLKTRSEVEEEISDRQGMWCICRKLATGFHEIRCTRFQDKVDSATLQKLKHLLISNP